MDQENIAYYIGSETAIGQKLDNEAASVLVIDDSLYKNWSGAHPVSSAFNHGFAQVSRSEIKGIFKKLVLDVHLDFDNVKAQQLSKKISSLSINDYLEKTKVGILMYLDWCQRNTKGIRGISRFSHWHHGNSGINRAANLLNTLESFSGETSLDLIKITVKKALRASSNKQHSLARFVCSALSGDTEMQKLTDASYKTIRSRL